MKKIAFLLAIAIMVACKKEDTKKEPLYPETKTTSSPAELGKEIFEEKGKCFACHNPDQKIIGPSIQEIAKTYKAKNGSIVDFLQEKSEPIVDPSQYEVMKTNFAITKSMSDEQLKALEAYFYSFAK